MKRSLLGRTDGWPDGWPGDWHGKNFTVSIFSDTSDVTNGVLCMMVLFIELFLFILLSVTVTVFQGHSSVKQVYENFMFLSDLS